MNIMADLKKKGIIRAHGISCHSLDVLNVGFEKVEEIDDYAARIRKVARITS